MLKREFLLRLFSDAHCDATVNMSAGSSAPGTPQQTAAADSISNASAFLVPTPEGLSTSASLNTPQTSATERTLETSGRFPTDGSTSDRDLDLSVTHTAGSVDERNPAGESSGVITEGVDMNARPTPIPNVPPQDASTDLAPKATELDRFRGYEPTYIEGQYRFIGDVDDDILYNEARDLFPYDGRVFST